MIIAKHFSRLAALLASVLLLCASPVAHADEMADANLLFKQGQRSQALKKVDFEVYPGERCYEESARLATDWFKTHL